MSGVSYTDEELFKLGRDNYNKLSLYCKKIEKEGLWEQARSVMNQSSAQMLDLYVQSVLVSLAKNCEEILESQYRFIEGITDTNPLEIRKGVPISEEVFSYAHNVAKLPPILIQLCGLYDSDKKEDMTKYFFDSFLNILLCMSYLNKDNNVIINKQIEKYLDKIESFVYSSGQMHDQYVSYVNQKLNSTYISNDVKWLISSMNVKKYSYSSSQAQSKNQIERKQGLANRKSSEGSMMQTRAFEEKDNAGNLKEEKDNISVNAYKENAADNKTDEPGIHKGDKQESPKTDKSTGVEKLINQKEEIINKENKKKRLLEEAEKKKKQAAKEAEKKRIKEAEEAEKKKRELAEEAEKRRKEEEMAKKQFQLVKKRLMDREKLERQMIDKKVETVVSQLNELVGLDEVKEEVRSLINLIKIRNMRERMNMPLVDMSYHMVFTGAPGTGKTTVARLVAKVYKELGVLSDGKLIETDRSRLVAGYVGQTAINVRETVEKAIGGVLFIDEAYSLASKDNTNDFGNEAIDTLVKMMEDHRDNLVIIVAGYTKEMDEFLKSNTGLLSRFNKFIDFRDYSSDELIEILNVMAASAGLKIDEAAKTNILGKLNSMNDQKRREFGNARGIRNVFEKMLVYQANRLVDIEEPTKEEIMNITFLDADKVCL